MLTPTERDASRPGEKHERGAKRGRDRRCAAAVHRRGVPRESARRPRGGSTASGSTTSPRIWRSATPPARSRGCTMRCTTRRSRTCSPRRPTPEPAASRTSSSRRALARGADRPARGDRALGAHDLRLDGPHARLQGLADERAGCERCLLRALRAECEGLVHAGAELRAVHEPRDRQPAGRPRQGARPGEGRVHHHPEGDRRRHLRVGRQGGGDRLGDHPLQFPRPERRDADQRHRPRGDVHHADERARREAYLPQLL